MRLMLILWALISWSSAAIAGDSRVLKIYHDADWMNNVESSEAIWRGMEVALDEVKYQVNGTRIELVKRNHSGNVTRSLRNMKDFIEDENAIAVFSGMHSPPLITNRSFINENKIPVLVPWAAGGPITRYPSSNNSVFRLSVDDTKAGEVLVKHAVSEYTCSRPYLLLENTAWGDSNAYSVKKALDVRGMSAVGIKRFDWSMKSHVARSLIHDVIRGGAECIILVSTSTEAAEIALAVSELDTEARIPLISHWGITGGNFHEIVNSQTREKLDLSFIQTCFSFLDLSRDPLPRTVFRRLQTLYPKTIETPRDLKSPAGLIHAYDLTKVFIAALENIEITDNIYANRNALKVALETLEDPVVGLIKTYESPFSTYAESKPDAHEALGREDICMAAYGPADEIVVAVRSKS